MSSRSAMLRAMIKWPLWMGSKLPPNNAIRSAMSSSRYRQGLAPLTMDFYMSAYTNLRGSLTDLCKLPGLANGTFRKASNCDPTCGVLASQRDISVRYRPCDCWVLGFHVAASPVVGDANRERTPHTKDGDTAAKRNPRTL